jgi:hypothetical protein
MNSQPTMKPHALGESLWRVDERGDLAAVQSDSDVRHLHVDRDRGSDTVYDRQGDNRGCRRDDA